MSLLLIKLKQTRRVHSVGQSHSIRNLRNAWCEKPC